MHQTLLILTFTSALWAQEPAITNAQRQNLAATGGLTAQLRQLAARQSGPAWIGYTVAKIPGEHNSCCWDNQGRGCGLEGNKTTGGPVARPGPVQLEGPTHVSILLRAEQGKIQKVRSFAIDCPLDGGGLPLYWLTGVAADQSVEVLVGLVAEDGATGERTKAVGDSAVHAIAMHAGPAAAAALDKMALSSPSEKIRRSALFWLANSRGRPGYLTVARASREDPSDKVREHAVFALTQSAEPEAMPAIIRVAKEDKVPHVRGQALFWLAQRASRQVATGAITEALDKDPDTEVKKKAVFALTQMPQDQGIPMLIQVARTNQNPAVRKQAMFWLGQSKDARALKYFEEVLTK
ncbi:MAG: HEAT repeat domain-containing protein [Acidobacteria bacterium]|nr:HEAT repeat domain-containing protein [Acidobacteriota bacterium]